MVLMRFQSILLLMTRQLLVAKSAQQQPRQSASPRVSPSSSAMTGQEAIAAAWIYLSDNTNYDHVPPKWNTIDFSKVDVLIIAPVGVQADGTFGLFKSQEKGDLSKRFTWTIEQAKKQNPNIKLIASQFWGGNPKTWGDDLSKLYSGDDAAIAKYATSVSDFMASWPSIDGYDVDYEDANINPKFPNVITAVHNALTAKGGKKYRLTVSPADTRYLSTLTSKIDYVNMQTYAVSADLNVKSFTGIGFKTDKLLYGFDAEQPQLGDDIDTVKEIYQREGLAGIHVWRLNSNILEAEGKRQGEIYAYLHPRD